MRLIEAILTTTTRAEAAKVSGVAERTLRRWSKLDLFAAELRRQRTRQLDATATILVAGAARCAQTLIEIAIGGGSPRDAVRASAARAVLDLATRFEEQSTFAARLTDLEAALCSKDSRDGGRRWQ